MSHVLKLTGDDRNPVASLGNRGVRLMLTAYSLKPKAYLP